jgi:hypothetical protein
MSIRSLIPAIAFMALSFCAFPVSAAECDRTCLAGYLDRYMTAMVKHDPMAAPLAPGFRQTENAEVVRPGEGLWKTLTALGKVQRRYLDATNGPGGLLRAD